MNGLKRLIPFLKPFRGSIFLAVVLGLVTNALWLGVAKLGKYIVDDILVAKDHKMLYQAPIIIISLMFVNGMCRFAHIFLLRFTGEKIAVKLRAAIHQKLMDLGLDFHSANQGGALISRTVNDVNYIQQGLSLFADVVKEPINVLMIIGFLLYTDWKLTLMSFIAAPLIGWASHRLGKSVRKYSFRMQENLEEFTSTLKESIDGVRVIKAFNLEPKLAAKMESINSVYLGIRRKILQREEVSGPLFEFLAAVLFAGILLYTGHQVIEGKLTAGDVMSFFFALGLLQQPVKKLQDANVRMQHTIASTERIFRILDSPITILDPPHPKSFPVNWKEIRFENVEFNYGSDQILKKISVQVKRGEVVAIVGASGSGKSTLVNLIPRYYDVTGGSVLIDDTDVRQFRVSDLRSQIALVTQDVFLFNETVEENIRGAQGEISIEKIEASAQAAYASSFIAKLQGGFKATVGDRGLKLSGGERQRISIARALYKNAPILILDEATSALDSQSEQEVQRALDRLMEGRTTFVIAHRLSTIQRANRILVMRDGVIVESGTHQELLAHGGEYQKLYSIQFSV